VSTNDYIQLASIVLSAVISGASLVIIVLTIRQNSKMIEESTRPNIVMYCTTTNFQDPQQYLVLKNFGKSSASITAFSANIDLSQYNLGSEYRIPFKNIVGATIAPEQLIISAIDAKKISEDSKYLEIKIDYSGKLKKYSETFSIRLDSHYGLVGCRASTKDKELKIISYTLQDIAEKML